MQKVLELMKSIKHHIPDIEIIAMDINETKHQVMHRYQEVMIVPLCAVTNNTDFLFTRGEKIVLTSDNVTCRVVEYKEIHLMDMEQETRELYKMSAWDFAQRWYRFDKGMQSMYFLKIKLERVNNDFQI